MNIQILGIREYHDEKSGKTKKAEKFFEKGWRAESVADILKNHGPIVQGIPESERYNLYFTVAECLEEKGRKLLQQSIIPFDIDHVDPTKVNETWATVMEALGLTKEMHGALWSGHGLQIFIKAHEPINDSGYFEPNRIYYKEICEKINVKLKQRGLTGSADPSVWSPARLMRMPGTINRKADKGLPDVNSYVLNDVILDEKFNFIKLSGIPVLSNDDQVDRNFMKGYPSPDAKEILSEKGCGFLAHCKAEPNKLSEEQWYGMLGITDWLPNGRAISHDYSRGYNGYSAIETDRKADQAKANAGPRTCKNINAIWGKCGSCIHFNKLTSPVQIRGKDFVVTEKTGFWSYKQTKDGNVVLNKPQVDDLLKHFVQNHEFVTVPESQELFIYNGSYWESRHTSYLQIYAKDRFSPAVPTHIYSEFEKNVLLTNTVPKDWFTRTTEGRFNLKNGVFDINSQELKPHSKEYGFTLELPYSYDKHAACPTFDKFMSEITVNRADLEAILLEYAGYSISNDRCWLEKAIFLNGDGANGKSTFVNVLRSLAGRDNFSSQKLGRVGAPIVNARLENKLFNVSEETNPNSLFENEDFKDMTAGGEITIKKLYQDEYEIKNKTKFIVLCNKLPASSDASYAFYRRIVVVPFDATFTEENRDIDIMSKLDVELSGIFNKIMAHYVELKNRKKLINSPTVNAANKEYADDSDICLKWIKQDFTINDDANKDKWMSASDIFQDYMQLCKFDWNMKPVSVVEFWKKVERIFPTVKDRRTRTFRSGKKMHVIRGLVRREELDAEF